MHYEINISLNGTHLFATAEHSITGEAKLAFMTRLMAEKFPASDGYRMSIARREEIGAFLDEGEVISGLKRPSVKALQGIYDAWVNADTE